MGLGGIHRSRDIDPLLVVLVSDSGRPCVHLDPSTLSSGFLRLHGVGAAGSSRKHPVPVEIYGHPALRISASPIVSAERMDQQTVCMSDWHRSLGAEGARHNVVLCRLLSLHRLAWA